MGGVGAEQKVLFGPVEIVSCVFLLLLKDGDAMSVQNVTFMLFNVKSREGSMLSSRLSCSAQEMEKYSLDLLRAVKDTEYAIKGKGEG